MKTSLLLCKRKLAQYKNNQENALLELGGFLEENIIEEFKFTTYEHQTKTNIDTIIKIKFDLEKNLFRNTTIFSLSKMLIPY